MKTKMVSYINMFNPSEIIVAKNKVLTEIQYINQRLVGKVFKNKEEKENFLRKIAYETECNCHHYTGDGGICYYRNCRHDMKDHP